MPGLSAHELTNRAIHLLFNRIRGLEWHYFQVDLKTVRTRAPTFSLEELVPEGSAYGWPGPGDPPSPQDTFQTLLSTFDDRPEIAREAFRRIFDLEEIPESTGAFSGFLGKLNERERRKRKRKYEQLVEKGVCHDRLTVVAEGDSWFQFPTLWVWRVKVRDVVKDIIDHLMGRDDLCLKSLAAGGDWLSNMLHSREYLPELSTTEPDAFLFSGGGNDMLGDGRAGNMVVHHRRVLDDLSRDPIRMELFRLRSRTLTDAPHFDPDRYENGLKVLSKEFFDFGDLLLVQFLLFFFNLRLADRFSDMAIITQGYDFALPTPGSTARWFNLRKWVNNFAGSGKWLWIPFEKKKLKGDQKKDAVYTMVTEFNELLIAIVESGRFDPIFHVDSRGLAAPKDWYDEIHLKSGPFGKVSSLFALAIRDSRDENAPRNRTYTVADLPRALEAWSEPLVSP